MELYRQNSGIKRVFRGENEGYPGEMFHKFSQKITISARKKAEKIKKKILYLHCNVSPPLVGKVLPIYMYITSKPFLGVRDIQIYSHLRSSFLEKLVKRDHKSRKKKKGFLFSQTFPINQRATACIS